MKNQPFHRRLSYSLSGIRAAFRSEASFRTQACFAAAALLLLLITRPKPLWWALVALTSALVLAAELINTALEQVVDRLHPERHPLIGKAKDCAAGAVLLLSLAALAVAGALVYEWLYP